VPAWACGRSLASSPACSLSMVWVEPLVVALKVTCIADDKVGQRGLARRLDPDRGAGDGRDGPREVQAVTAMDTRTAVVLSDVLVCVRGTRARAAHRDADRQAHDHLHPGTPLRRPAWARPVRSQPGLVERRLQHNGETPAQAQGRAGTCWGANPYSAARIRRKLCCWRMTASSAGPPGSKIAHAVRRPAPRSWEPQSRAGPGPGQRCSRDREGCP